MEYVIEGGDLPVLRFRLNAGESLISEAGGRTWSKGPLETEAVSNGGIGKVLGRAFSGESLLLSRYTAHGDCEIGFTSSFPGEILPIELGPGEQILAQKTAFLCGTEGIDLEIAFQRRIGAGFFGGEGFILQKITGPGTVFLEIDGYCLKEELSAGEEIVMDTGVLAAMDSSCDMDIRTVKGLKNVLFGREGLFDTVVRGPGRVYMQSMPISKLANLFYNPNSK